MLLWIFTACNQGGRHMAAKVDLQDVTLTTSDTTLMGNALIKQEEEKSEA